MIQSLIRLEKYWVVIFGALSIIISFMILAKGWSFYNQPKAEGFAFEIRWTLGKALFFSLACFLVGSSWKKFWKTRKQFWYFCFSTLLLLTSSYRSFHMYKEADQIENAKMALSSRLGNDFGEMGSLIAQSSSHSPQNYGDLEVLLKVQKQLADFAEQENLRCQNALQKVNLEKILSPQNLCEHKHIINSKVATEGAIQAIIESENRYRECFLNLKREYETFPFKDKSNKRAFIEGLEEGVKNAELSFTHILRETKELLVEVTSFLDFFSKIQGAYHFANGKMTFESYENAQMCNKYLQNISALERSLEQQERAIFEKQKAKRVS